MKPATHIDYLRLLREEVAALCAIKCHMSHERIERAGEPPLPVVCRLPEGSYQRVGLCSPEVRARRIGCSHTTARIKLQDAINVLNADNVWDGGQGSALSGELNWLNNQIHLLDHGRSEAENVLAKMEENMYLAGDRVQREEELTEARKAVLEMEQLHDKYVEQIGVLRDRVLNKLDNLIEQAGTGQGLYAESDGDDSV